MVIIMVGVSVSISFRVQVRVRVVGASVQSVGVVDPRKAKLWPDVTRQPHVTPSLKYIYIIPGIGVVTVLAGSVMGGGISCCCWWLLPLLLLFFFLSNFSSFY